MAKYSLNQLKVFLEASEKNLIAAQTRVQQRKPHQSLGELLNALGTAEAEVDFYRDAIHNYGKSGSIVQVKVQVKDKGSMDYPTFNRELYYTDVDTGEIFDLVKRDLEKNYLYRIESVKTLTLGIIN